MKLKWNEKSTADKTMLVLRIIIGGVKPMKKAYWICYILSFCFCIIGIVFRDWLNITDIIFVLLSAALFMFAFVQHCISKAQRCPNCNAIIYSGHIRTIARQKDGIVPCEKCGSLVCVNYSYRK